MQGSFEVPCPACAPAPALSPAENLVMYNFPRALESRGVWGCARKRCWERDSRASCWCGTWPQEGTAAHGEERQQRGRWCHTRGALVTRLLPRTFAEMLQFQTELLLPKEWGSRAICPPIPFHQGPQAASRGLNFSSLSFPGKALARRFPWDSGRKARPSEGRWGRECGREHRQLLLQYINYPWESPLGGTILTRSAP